MSSTIPLADAHVGASGFSPKGLSRLHHCIQQFVDEEKHAGVSLLLLRKGEVADFFAAGFRDRSIEAPMQRDTIVRVYSMTKIVVSVAALSLVEEGRLGLLDRVKDYLPEFGDPQVIIGGTSQNPQLIPASEPITIHHLFTHSSGIIYEAAGHPIGEMYQQAGLETADSLAELVRHLARLPLKQQPGTMFEYGYSTDVLARVIEVVSGQSLDVFLKERILNPLDMEDTDFVVPESKKDRLAKVYQHDPSGELQALPSLAGEVREGVRRYPAGSAGLFSTLEDFGRFGQMLCNGGTLGGLQILSPKAFQHMIADHLSGLPVANRTFTAGYGFGLGVAVRINDGLAGTLGTLGSFGWSGMATTLFSVDPAEELVMLLFAQHLPFDEHGLFQRFTNLVYQALR
ncbi:MAG TPA: serine hydrolase domain-containing protein [Chthoniobacterales bacterium]|nr:serine hydrolase domain-containing protein [Chthoniobacterales bacterium]